MWNLKTGIMRIAFLAPPRISFDHANLAVAGCVHIPRCLLNWVVERLVSSRLADFDHAHPLALPVEARPRTWRTLTPCTLH